MLVVAGADQIMAKPLPEVPQAAVDELGVSAGIPRMSGFVFIDGRYIPPPYTVTRKGNGLFINRIQIEQPVPWTYFDPEADIQPAVQDGNVAEFGDDPANAVQPAVPVMAVDEEQAPKKVSSIDDLFGDDQQDKPAPEAKKSENKTISSIDDLFGGGGEVETPAPAPVKKRSVGSIDDLFSDDDGNTPAVPPVVQPRAEMEIREDPVMHAPPELTPDELEKRKDILKKQLDEKRAFYERALAMDELYFFGTTHTRLNGTYGTARALFEVLPSALRYSRSPDDLMQRLRAGNVYFVDYAVCDALYQNKRTFPLIQQRLDKIKYEEAQKAAATRSTTTSY